MADDDRQPQPLILDESQCIGGLGLDGVVHFSAPLRVTVAALVKGEDVIAAGEMEAHEVPRVGRLVAAVKEEHGRSTELAPLQEVEPQASDHGLPGEVPTVGS